MTQLPIARDPLALPRDAKLLSLLLESLGVCDSDPAALHMLLEFGSRHLTELLSDASLYADHAERRDLTVDDVRLAVEGRALTSFTSPPSKDFMLELADKKNSLPLPSVPQKFGLRLPVDRHTLTAPTLTIVPAPKKRPSEEDSTSAPVASDKKASRGGAKKTQRSKKQRATTDEEEEEAEEQDEEEEEDAEEDLVVPPPAPVLTRGNRPRAASASTKKKGKGKQQKMDLDDDEQETTDNVSNDEEEEDDDYDIL